MDMLDDLRGLVEVVRLDGEGGLLKLKLPVCIKGQKSHFSFLNLKVENQKNLRNREQNYVNLARTQNLLAIFLLRVFFIQY